MNKREVIEKIKEQILEANNSNDFSKINSDLTKKRLNWLENNLGDVDEPSIVKKAYFLLIKKMEIDLSEVPIIFEDEKKITYRSYNWCPVLEACKELGLDTREICKKGWENSVNEFVKKIHPKLTFSRKYNTLRPHGKFCEETIELIE
ncbi:MAG: hypothetical protein KKF46_05275 [Nanoarchaeota archaeon]|nr:hypothetical protein [Nanoarchaeota archaeon]MBU1321745.1 hypothetical protein [Nanoarchaeota archaeon]MBU1597469.1 hypothetical protein [Nanoarchaeota archaeon]MBU2441407.1 hypothetical protein [Nanoarchaeota archaeon]